MPQPWKVKNETRAMLAGATAADLALKVAEDIVDAHYAQVRSLYDEPTMGHAYVLAKVNGTAP